MAKIDYQKDCEFADSIFSKLNKRLPIKGMMNIGRNNIPHYLYESAEKCYCTSCNRTFNMKVLDKHNTDRNCPKCRKAVNVQRNNGSILKYNEANILYPECIDGTIVLRFFKYRNSCTNGKNGNVSVTEDFEEVGREIVTSKCCLRFEKGAWYVPDWSLDFATKDGWHRLRNSDYSGRYFSISRDMLRRCYNKEGILFNFPYVPQFSKIVDQYVSFEYYNMYLADLSKDRFYWGAKPFDTTWKSEDRYGSLFESAIYDKYNDLCEKFYKLGIQDILLNNHEKDTWAKMVKKNPNASILDILKVNRAELRWIRSKDDKEKDYAYKCVKSGQSYKLNLNQLDKVFAVKGLYDMDILVKNTNKICSYLHRQNITVSEYKHYKRLLTDNGFPMDNSNLYPKDFRKAEMRVMDEIDMIKAKAHEKESQLIETLSKALREMPDIDEYIGGSRGLIVKVPENAQELISEGTKLHNCLSSYVDRVARGECIIFFIRRIDEPDKPFYAMEYRNGHINQLYTYNNKHDEDYDVVYTFCTGLVDILNKLNYQPREIVKAA